MRIILAFLIVFSFSYIEKVTDDHKEYPIDFQLSEVLDKSPEYYVLEWKKGTRLTLEKTDIFVAIDSVTKQQVCALLNQNKEPVLYTSDISTPVCADGECKLMNFKLYWTLLGEYAGFDTYAESPLTKHEHEEFTSADYKKLHELLIDDKSIFGRRSIDRLVEKPKMRTVNGVDAISGATIAQVKESVVSGALYSCYKAWHLVHGKIRNELKSQTHKVLNEKIITKMLYSKNAEYQVFALNRIDEAKYAEHYIQIASVFKTTTPLVRSIIAKNLINKYKEKPTFQKPFWEAFDKIDLGSRSLLLNHVGDAPYFANEILSTKLGDMSKNQLKVFLGHLSKQEDINKKTQHHIQEFANSQDETYAYLAQDFINNK